MITQRGAAMSRTPASVFKRGVIATAVCVAVVGGTALYAHWQLYLPPECRGAVPEQVPFHQGMTLCPGQSAIITLEIPSYEGGKHGNEGRDL